MASASIVSTASGLTTGIESLWSASMTGLDQMLLRLLRKRITMSSGATPCRSISHCTSRATPFTSADWFANLRYRATPVLQCPAGDNRGRRGRSGKPSITWRAHSKIEVPHRWLIDSV